MPERGYLTATVSTCAACGRLLPARVHLGDDGVYLHKHCPAHGPQSPRIYADPRYYLDLFRFHRAGALPLAFGAAMTDACPANCGLCPEHEQHLCLPILEITDHCDLACPVCLVRPRGSYHLEVGQVERVLDHLIAAEGQIDVLNLSGGEPTVHPQFRAIVEACGRRPEVLCVSVSTNGRRLARDPELLAFLAQRRVVIALQYDGPTRAAADALRGADLLAEKQRLIDVAAAAGARLSLTMTMARGVNDGAEVQHVLGLLFAHDHVLSVMIQPMAYVGVGAGVARPADPVTIPDVLRLVDGAAGGRVAAGDFAPLPCSHPACFARAFYLRTEGAGFLPVRRLVRTQRYLDLIQNRALPGLDAQSLGHVRDALYELWSSPEGLGPEAQNALRAVKRILGGLNQASGPAAAFASAQQAIKTIFIHQFMDRHSFDLARARKCCQCYPQPDGRLVPACVYNCLRRPG